MIIDNIVKLLDAITRLTAEIAWPLLALFVLLRFRPAIRSFFESLGEFSLKGAGLEASAKKRQIEAATNLAVASRTIIGPLIEQFRMRLVPLFHCLDGRFALQS